MRRSNVADLTPLEHPNVGAVLALVAACLLGPLRRPEMERAKRAEAVGRERQGEPPR